MANVPMCETRSIRPRPPRPTVIVADGDLSRLQLALGALDAAGFVVRPAHDAGTALALARRRRPDALVIDVDLWTHGHGDALAGLAASAGMVLLSRDAATGPLQPGLAVVRTPFTNRSLLAGTRRALRRAG